MFPTTVTKKETYVIKETREFAGEKVVVERKVEVGSEQDEAMKRKKQGSKSNLDDLLDKLSGKTKKMTTIAKTEVSMISQYVHSESCHSWVFADV
jgi:hypothetical protein